MHEVAQVLGRAPRRGRAEAEEPADRRALHASELHLAAGDRVGGEAPLPVGRPRQGEQARQAGDGAAVLRDVADRPDVGVLGPHGVVDQHSARGSYREPRPARQLCAGPGLRRARAADHRVMT